MTTSLRNPLEGELWLAYIAYSDIPSIGKVRPVVIVSQQHDGTVAVLKVTTKTTLRKYGATLVYLQDWPIEGLKAPSYVGTDAPIYLESGALLRNEPIGSLSYRDMQRVFRSLLFGF